LNSNQQQQQANRICSKNNFQSDRKSAIFQLRIDQHT